MAYEIDMTQPLPNYKQFYPDRKTMQSLVTRAMNMKPDEVTADLPLVDVRGYLRMKTDNRDLDF